MKEIKLNVYGMLCNGCEKRVINFLGQITGVKEVIANYIDKTVIIKAVEGVDVNSIIEKVEELGFEVKGD